MSFKYPKNWTLKPGSNNFDPNTLTSPSGFSLNYFDSEALGSGSSCTEPVVTLSAVRRITIPGNGSANSYIVESGKDLALYMATSGRAKVKTGDVVGCFFGPSLVSKQHPDTDSEPGERIGFTTQKYFTGGTLPASQAYDYKVAEQILFTFKYDQ